MNSKIKNVFQNVSYSVLANGINTLAGRHLLSVVNPAYARRIDKIMKLSREVKSYAFYTSCATNRKYTLFIAKRGLLSSVCVKVCVKNNSLSKEIGTEYGNAGIFS